MDMDCLPNVLEAVKKKSRPVEDFSDEEDFEPLVFKRTVRPRAPFEYYSDEDGKEDSEAQVLKRSIWPRAPYKYYSDDEDSEPLLYKRMVRPRPSFDYYPDEEDSEPLLFKRTIRPSAAAKSMSPGVSSSSVSTTALKAGVTGFVSGRKPKLVLCPKRMETEENTARQAQRQMHRFTSTVTELCTGFETSKKKNEELVKQVTYLEGQIQKWKDQKASWDEKKKELERERNKARKKALVAVVKKRKIEDKLEKATKQVDDAKASAKKAIYEAVALTTRCYKNCLGNFAASLANGEGDSLKDYAKELVKEMLCGDRALADGDVHVAGNTASGTEHDFPVHCPEPKYKINMETVEMTGRQAQMRMHRFASTFAGLSTSFETAKKKMKELGKQVPDLVQIEKWNNEKASWDEKKKELEREHSEAREAALKAVGEKRDLEKKLEKAIKEAEDAKASAKRAIDEKHDLEVKLKKAAKHAESVEASTKKAINEAALKFVNEKRDLEEKLTRAVKQVEDAQASGTKAIYEAVASTTNCYKICLDNFVASLGNDEGKSLEDHVTKVFKAMPHDDGAPADVAIDMAGHEGDGG
ncbi:hypothetical protein POM88_040056 [Heracleum sosnowskyi]|uniref:Uncharacterized protein n=1 Tax=Heracleum sosnowskyi TaxID=360622 RepID=A0AAD8HE98_9APIA|nr:hypothetical protein POM88_040056 [Heracleum sosnowskyi]